MGNYRTKIRRAGCQVTVNAEKEAVKTLRMNHHTNIKRSKCAKVNFLPNFPQGENPASLEHLRQAVVEEVKKMERNLPLISKMMQSTFAIRRQIIVVLLMVCPPVKEIMDLWPALHIQSEVMWFTSIMLLSLLEINTFILCSFLCFNFATACHIVCSVA